MESDEGQQPMGDTLELCRPTRWPPSYLWSRLNQSQRNKIKNVVPWAHKSHFKSWLAAHGKWLPDWTVASS